MLSEFEVRPATYVAPNGTIERAICKALFKVMLNSPRFVLDFGDQANELARSGEFVVAAPRALTILKLIPPPNLWVGEAYVDGQWYLRKGHLSDFLRVIAQDANKTFRRYYELMSVVKGVRFWLGQYAWNRRYTRRVKQHYDLDSQIYEMILDPELIYTCAFFLNENDTLQSAQQNKIEAAIERMSLPTSGAQVLDIGSGWGAMARAIVRQNNTAQVCGLSISKNQLAWSKKRDEECLLPAEARRIEYRLEDYIDHERGNYYDAISVIGMIEHVGLGGYPEFFSQVHRLLKPGAKALIHTIVSPSSSVPSNRWIDKHIFSGGYTPSISELTRAAEEQAFRIAGLHVYEPRHYRKTIECWLSNFERNASMLRSYLTDVNHNEREVGRMMRTWMFYLSAVRNMFLGEEGSHQVVQLCLEKSRN